MTTTTTTTIVTGGGGGDDDNNGDGESYSSSEALDSTALLVLGVRMQSCNQGV
jgi:hypothetical protein